MSDLTLITPHPYRAILAGFMACILWMRICYMLLTAVWHGGRRVETVVVALITARIIHC